jgi:hypothetical protein
LSLDRGNGANHPGPPHPGDGREGRPRGAGEHDDDDVDVFFFSFLGTPGSLLVGGVPGGCESTTTHGTRTSVGLVCVCRSVAVCFCDWGRVAENALRASEAWASSRSSRAPTLPRRRNRESPPAASILLPAPSLTITKPTTQQHHTHTAPTNTPIGGVSRPVLPPSTPQKQEGSKEVEEAKKQRKQCCPRSAPSRRSSGQFSSSARRAAASRSVVV